MNNNKSIQVLIIEDHPLIVEAYFKAFDIISKKLSGFNFNITTVEDCSRAEVKIENSIKENSIYDLVLLDIRLPSKDDSTIHSGEDIGVLITEKSPNSKIIISTTLNDNFRVYNIMKNINPDGFLIKNDINSEEILEAIEKVLNETPYFSKTVLKYLRNQFSNDFVLDQFDRQILYELSLGTKMKDMPNTIALSLPSIEKRKKNLKELFNIESSEDRELILVAKEKGFL